MNQDWDIKPRSNGCLKCATPFADRQPYFTRLRFTAQGYERADYCQACAPSDPEPGYSSWKGVFKLPPAEPDRAVKKETAESLLRGLIAKGAEANSNVVYILAVMLERQRVLAEREVQTRPDGVRIRVYEHKKTGDVFTIRDPQLRLDQLAHVQQEVAAMLSTPGAADTPAGASPGGSPVTRASA